MLCFYLAKKLTNDAVVAILVVVIGSAAIAVGTYFILTNLPPSLRSSMPAPTVSIARNWAGYVAATDLANPQSAAVGVSGSWTVPAVTDIGTDAFSAVWVGIGGQFDKTLIQVGTEQDFIGGSPSYSAWYEMLPADSITIDAMQVSPGDRMEASVTLIDPASNLWSISLADLTSGQSFQNNFTYNSQQLTAEWIVERPDVNNAISQLADFGSVTFSSCNANLGKTGAISDFQNSKVLMDAQTQNNQSVQLVDVSDLSAQGTQFTATYLTG